MRALALLLPLVVLAGCVGPPVVTPVPTPTATPVFASDEEALAAAEEAYAAYLKLADQVFAEGGVNPERLASVATGEQLAADVAGFDEARREGLRGTGTTEFSELVLQQFDPRTDVNMVVVYLCEDVSGTDVIDANGVSTVTPDRPNMVTYQVSFDLDRPSESLLVADKEVWAQSC